ncbi:MAG: hypothetical protein L0271_20075, partial [Gemmatimonadetes bacterium]|nr:hypothetical protein [Gemmatimonadota bacterium]
VREARGGTADTPIAAWAAATRAKTGGVGCVEPGSDRTYLAMLPLDVLEPEPRLHALLEGVGIETCAALAQLSRESVEVRFGPDALTVWRLARGEDARRLFRAPPASTVTASLDFIDYVVTDPERLLFTANTLLGGICDGLRERGAHARRMDIALPLANGEVWRRTLAAGRPTASRSAWLRLVRSLLERLTVQDAVAGMCFDVRTTETAAAVQGDLFDAGFGTATAVETALSRLVETYGPVLVQPETTSHPLLERRIVFAEIEPDVILIDDPGRRIDTGSAAARSTVHNGDLAELAKYENADPERYARAAQRLPDPARETRSSEGTASGFELTLQVLPDPRPVQVLTTERRDHVLPASYRDGMWRRFVRVEGPDRVSGGQWDDAYAREYYRGLTTDGQLVWLFRDALADRWYLHGWWD